MNPTQLTALLHLTDSAFPTGAFSHSYGLETYTQLGEVHDAATLTVFLAERLQHGLARFDLILLHVALTATDDEIAVLEGRINAMVTPYELREASITVGRRFLRSAVPLYGGERSARYTAAVREKRLSGHYALAYGVLVGDLGIPAAAAMTAFTQAFVMSQAAAAVKLVNIGQTQTQAVIRALGPAIDDTVNAALERSLDDLSVFTPLLDIRAAQHEYLFRRLFIS